MPTGPRTWEIRGKEVKVDRGIWTVDGRRVDPLLPGKDPLDWGYANAAWQEAVRQSFKELNVEVKHLNNEIRKLNNQIRRPKTLRPQRRPGMAAPSRP
jgi:hypothetical protein